MVAAKLNDAYHSKERNKNTFAEKTDRRRFHPRIPDSLKCAPELAFRCDKIVTAARRTAKNSPPIFVA